MKLFLCISYENDEKTIVDCIKSVVKLADVQAILACSLLPQSKTKDVLEEYMLTSKIPIKFLEGDSEDFSKTKNMLLQEVKSFPPGNDSYILFMNGSSILDQGKIEDTEFTADAYSINTILGDVVFGNVVLLKSSVDWEWKGFWKEFPTQKGKTSFDVVNTVKFTIIESTTKEKMIHGKDLLLKEPDSKRKNLYLAWCFREIGDMAAAKKYIRSYFDLDPSEETEEFWYAKYILSRIEDTISSKEESLPKDRISQIKDMYLSTWSLRPKRSEPLFHLSLFLLRNKMDMEALLSATIAKNIGYPVGDFIFVEYNIYAKFINMIYSLIFDGYLSKAGVPSKKIQVAKTEMLVMINDVLYDKTVSNKNDFIEIMKSRIGELHKSYSTKTIPIPKPEGIISSCITNQKDGFLFLVQRKNTVSIFELGADLTPVQGKEPIILSLDSEDASSPSILSSPIGEFFVTYKGKDKVLHILNKDGAEVGTLDDGISMFVPGDEKDSLVSGVKSLPRKIPSPIIHMEDISVLFPPVSFSEGKKNLVICSNNKVPGSIVSVVLSEGGVEFISIPYKITPSEVPEKSVFTSFIVTKEGKALFVAKDKITTFDVNNILQLPGTQP